MKDLNGKNKFDYKDYRDVKIPNNYYEDLEDFDIEDAEIMKKDLTEYELQVFRDKVKEYCESFLEGYFRGYDELDFEELYTVVETQASKEDFDEKLLEEFYGQNEMFFKYAREIVKELVDEYNKENAEMITERKKSEFKSELEKILQRNCNFEDKVEYTLKLLEKNESYKTIDDANIIREFIIYHSYIPSEILDYIDLELIQEDDYLMKDILDCWIVPSKYLSGLIEGINETEHYYTGIGYIEPYEMYEHYFDTTTVDTIDFSEYYEKFYNKVINENTSGVGTFDYEDSILYYTMLQKMPSRAFERLGGFSSKLMHGWFPNEFIIMKLIEENKFDEIDDFTDLLTDPDNDERARFINIFTRMSINGKFDGFSNKNLRDKIRKYTVDLSDKILEQDDLESMQYYIERGEFLLESYIREERDIPDKLKDVLSEKDGEINKKIEKIREEIRKEEELIKLQEEDQKCDEALKLAEQLENENREQEGQTQGDE